jgi:hypothetical protein
MKEMYVSPVIEVVEYEVEDVITASAVLVDLAKDDNNFNDKWTV